MRKIRIALADHLMMEVAAEVYGAWAAHPFATGWRVSHVPSGRGLQDLADGLERHEAMFIARTLAERVPTPDIGQPDSDDHYLILSTVGEALEP